MTLLDFGEQIMNEWINDHFIALTNPSANTGHWRHLEAGECLEPKAHSSWRGRVGARWSGCPVEWWKCPGMWFRASGHLWWLNSGNAAASDWARWECPHTPHWEDRHWKKISFKRRSDLSHGSLMLNVSLIAIIVSITELFSMWMLAVLRCMQICSSTTCSVDIPFGMLVQVLASTSCPASCWFCFPESKY